MSLLFHPNGFNQGTKGCSEGSLVLYMAGHQRQKYVESGIGITLVESLVASLVAPPVETGPTHNTSPKYLHTASQSCHSAVLKGVWLCES